MNQQVFFCLLSICLISSSFTSSTPVPAPEKNIIPEEKFRTCTATEKAFVKESYSNAQQVENLDNQPCKNDSEDFDHQGRGKPVLWYSEDANSCLLMEKLCLREKLIVRTFKVMSDGEIMEKNGEGIRGVSRSLCGCRGGKCGCRGGSCGCAARDPKRREQLLAQLRAQLEQQVANRPAGGCPRCRRSLKQTEEKIDKHAWTPKDEVPKEIESKIDNHAWVPKDEKTSTANKSKIDSYAWTPTDEQSSPNASQQISELEQQIKSKISELADLKNGNQSTDGNHGY